LIRELTAGEITSSALTELSLRGWECWRQNQIRVPGRNFVGRLGLTDILGFNRRTGIILLCEVKTINDELSDDQITLLCQVKTAGGMALVATDDGKGGIKIIDYQEFHNVDV